MVLTPGLLEEHSDEGAEVTFLVGEGIVIGGEASTWDVLHWPNVLNVSRILSLAGHPHRVRFRFSRLERQVTKDKWLVVDMAFVF